MTAARPAPATRLLELEGIEPPPPGWTVRVPDAWARRATGLIYFIRAVSGGPIKIGYTRDIAERLGRLQIGNPEELRVLHAAPGSPRGERMLHARFERLRVRGEWFRADPELLAYIAELGGTP